MLDPRRVRSFAVLAGIAILVVTLAALLTPGIRPGGLANETGHFLLFGGLGFVVGLYRGAGPQRRVLRDLLGLLVGLLAFAALTELGQFLVEDRSPERADIIADAAGSAAGLFTGALAGLILAERPGRRRP